MKISVAALGGAALLLLIGFLVWKSALVRTTEGPASVSTDLRMVNINDDPAAPGHAVAEIYFARDIADAQKLQGAVPPSIGAAEVDLNADGQMEIIATLQGSGICGASNCPAAILMKEGGKWRNVLENVSAQFFSLAPTYTNGMQDLILSSGGKVWKWNGEMYE